MPGLVAKSAAALCALQVVLLIVLPTVTKTQLDADGGDCDLNLAPGRVCDFVYVSTGFGFFFSFVLLAFAVAALRKQPAFLPVIAGALALFGAFWFMVLAITITLRGQQAADAGQGPDGPRTGVIALAWLEAILYFFIFVLSGVDGYSAAQYRKTARVADSKAQLLAVEQRPRHVATQALGHTPIF